MSTECFVGLFQALEIFYIVPAYGMYNVLHVVTASGCDHRYKLIFSLIVFLHLEIDYAHIAQWEKIEPSAFIFIASLY